MATLENAHQAKLTSTSRLKLFAWDETKGSQIALVYLVMQMVGSGARWLLGPIRRRRNAFDRDAIGFRPRRVGDAIASRDGLPEASGIERKGEELTRSDWRQGLIVERQL
jgi:hypothetical protein